ncbi:hypothetical protein BsWGS_05766 [Bradybaena similaris]
MGNQWTSFVENHCGSGSPPALTPEEALRKENNAKTRSLFFEILFYVAFLTLLVIMSYNNRDTRAFRAKQSISKSLDAEGNFNKIIQPDAMWTWAQTTLVSFLHPDSKKTSIHFGHGERLVSNLVSYRIGPTRFRQHRARDGTCSLHAVMSNLGVRCSAPWSSVDRDWTDYGTNWTHHGTKWTTSSQEQATNQTQAPSNAAVVDDMHGALQNISSAWLYRTWEDIGGLPITGNLGVYPPGGYVFDVVGSRDDSVSMLKDLQSSNWVDNRTRVVLIELTLYSPNVNLFAKVTAVFEFPQAHVVMGYLHIHSFRLFAYLGNHPILRMVGDYLVYAVTLLFVIREVCKICHERMQYFKKFWNIIELINVVCSVGAVVLHVGRHIISKHVSKEAFQTTGQFYNFQTLAVWDELFGFIIAFVCFMAILQIVNLLRFNKRMSVLGATLMRSAGELWSFLLVFLLMLFAFLCFSYVTYGAFMRSYRTVVDAFESLLLISLGKLEYKLMNEVSRVLTAAFTILYTLFIIFILLNMLVSILTDSFAEVREDVNNQPNDYELISYIVSVVTFFLWRFSPVRAVWVAVCKAGLISESEPASVRYPTAQPSGQTTPTAPSSQQLTPTAPSSQQVAPTAPSSVPVTPTTLSSVLTTPVVSSSKQQSIHHGTMSMYTHCGSDNEDVLNAQTSLIGNMLDKLTEKINYLLETEGFGHLTQEVATVSKRLKNCSADSDGICNDEHVFMKQKCKRKVTFHTDVEDRQGKGTVSGLDLGSEDPFSSDGNVPVTPCMDHWVPDLDNSEFWDVSYNSYMHHLCGTFSSDGPDKAQICKHPLEVQVEVLDEFYTCGSDSSFNLSDTMYSCREDSGFSKKNAELSITSTQNANDRPCLAQTNV